HQLGLDQPLLQQYLHYTGNVLRGDFGTSFYTHLPVSTELSSRIGAELELIGLAVAIILVLGIGGGIIVAALTQQGRHPFIGGMLLLCREFVGSARGCVAAPLRALLFAATWKIFPVAGNSPADAVVLPALSVALPQSALMARIVRVEALNVLAQNYVRSARSKRLGAFTIYFRYVLPNVLTAALTLGGTIFPASLASP